MRAHQLLSDHRQPKHQAVLGPSGLELVSIMHSANALQVKKTAKVFRDCESDEFLVQFFIGTTHLEEADYSTSDKVDAIGTATAFAVKTRATKSVTAQ